MIDLYNIQQKYLNILIQIQEDEGVLTEETEAALKITSDNLAEKSTAYVDILKMLDGNIEAGNKEIERIKSFIQVKENAAARIKETLLQGLLLFGKEDKKKEGDEMGIKRLEFDTFKLSTRKSKSVNILDDDVIDDKFTSYTIPKIDSETYKIILSKFPELEEEAKKTISKKALGVTLKAREEVRGARYETKYGLTIK